MSAKNIVAGNWKMNLNFGEGEVLASEIMKNFDAGTVQIILAPPFVHLQRIAMMAGHHNDIEVAAQNCNENAAGAFTGEVSATMLHSIGVKYVIIGHSERRELYNESNEVIKKKVTAALSSSLKVIFCCGEPLSVRKEGSHKAYVLRQLEESLFSLKEEDISNVVIAYEPIWAIGTGETASPQQAQEMHKFIREEVSKKYSVGIASKISILYGGSVKSSNAKDIFAGEDVNGGLVGGASLEAKDFLTIVNSF